MDSEDVLLDDASESPLVLIADDEQYAQLLMQRILQREHFRTASANTGRMAIDKAKELRPDLILMDIQMPDIDGFKAVELLRQDSTTGRIPIIVVTAAAREPADVARGLGLGADDYLRKPFSTSELVARARSKIRAYHLEERLQQRTQELEALIRIGSELNQALEIDALADRLISAVLEELPASHAVLTVINERGEPLLARWHGWEGDGPPVEQLLTPDTLAGYTLSTGEAALIVDIAEDKRIPSIFGESQAVSGMAAPLKHHGQIVGVLALGDPTRQRFSAGSLRLLRSIAEEAALAVRNAQLYSELRGYASGLESMVEARTAALQSAQAQLVRAEKLASLGTLAAGIAHEVNNPLQPILTNLEMALEDIDADRPVDRELLDFAKRDVQRIRGIVGRLLDFARPGQGVLEPLDVDDVMQEVLMLAGKQLEHSRVKVETNLAVSRPIQGNADQLKQVFLNLVVNAMEAMPEGGQLTICSTEKDDYAMVSVLDTGIGIPEESLPRVFDPFYTTKPHGTGLGLSVSYGIIEGHGGHIEVQSVLGEFTEFKVWLPLAPDK